MEHPVYLKYVPKYDFFVFKNGMAGISYEMPGIPGKCLEFQSVCLADNPVMFPYKVAWVEQHRFQHNGWHDYKSSWNNKVGSSNTNTWNPIKFRYFASCIFLYKWASILCRTASPIIRSHIWVTSRRTFFFHWVGLRLNDWLVWGTLRYGGWDKFPHTLLFSGWWSLSFI